MFDTTTATTLDDYDTDERTTADLYAAAWDLAWS